MGVLSGMKHGQNVKQEKVGNKILKIMTTLEKRASDYSYENYIDYVDAWGEHDNDFQEIKEAYIDGAEYMLARVCKWLNDYADGYGIPEKESGGVYVDDLIDCLKEDMGE